MVVASVVVTNGAVAAMWAVGAVTVKASTMFDLIQPTDANTASIIHLIVIMIPTICCMLETLLSARTNRTGPSRWYFSTMMFLWGCQELGLEDRDQH